MVSPTSHTPFGAFPSCLFPPGHPPSAAGRSQSFGCPPRGAHPCPRSSDNQTLPAPSHGSLNPPHLILQHIHAHHRIFKPPTPSSFCLKNPNKGSGRPVSCPSSIFLPLAAEKRDSAVPSACEKPPPALCFMKENLLGRAAKRSQPPAGCFRWER